MLLLKTLILWRHTKYGIIERYFASWNRNNAIYFLTSDDILASKNISCGNNLLNNILFCNPRYFWVYNPLSQALSPKICHGFQKDIYSIRSVVNPYLDHH